MMHKSSYEASINVGNVKRAGEYTETCYWIPEQFEIATISKADQRYALATSAILTMPDYVSSLQYS